MTRGDLLPLWQADAEKICPGIRLYDEAEMQEAIGKARRFLNSKGFTLQSDIGTVVTVLRNMLDHHEDVWRVPENFWWLKACTVILPDLSLNPWFECMWHQFTQSRGKRKLDTLWGSSNCSKSEYLGSLAWINSIVWSSNAAHTYITSPWKEYGSDKVWRVMTRRCEAWDREKPEWMKQTLTEVRRTADEIVVHNIKKDEAGQSTITFVASHNSASIQGKKREGQLFNSDPRHGIMLLLGDEFIENTNSEFAEAESNFISNSNAYVAIACNPKPEKIQEPNLVSFSEPYDPENNLSRNDLDEYTSFRWPTERGTLLRFCSYNSPNRFTDELDLPPPFPYLIHRKQAEAQERRGEANAKAQVKAWGWSDNMLGSRLSAKDFQKADVIGPVVWLKPPTRSMFVDLAFGGKDPCTYTIFEFGTNHEQKEDLQVVQQTEIKVKRDWKPTAEELTEFRALHAKPSLLKELQPDVAVEPSYHAAYMILKEVQTHRIPKGNVSFDASQRADAYRIVGEALGTVKWYYEGSKRLIDEEAGWKIYPPEYHNDGTPVVWSDRVTRTISMIWEFCEALIAEGKIKNLRVAEKGCRELIARPRDTTSAGKGLKKDVRGKDKLPRSPTWAETLCIGVYYTVRFLGALPGLFTEITSLQVPDFDPEAYGFSGVDTDVDAECFV